MKKGFSLPLLLIILSLLFGAFLFITSKDPKTSLETPDFLLVQEKDTKTYNNKTYGFKLEYPKDFEKKEYQDFAADFTGEVLPENEATPQAVAIRFSTSNESYDEREFERIMNLKTNRSFFEPLDVRSIITKIGDTKIGDSPTIEYSVERNFSAPEGPRKEFRHVFEIKKEETILRFLTAASTEKDLEPQIEALKKLVNSIMFN